MASPSTQHQVQSSSPWLQSAARLPPPLTSYGFLACLQPKGLLSFAEYIKPAPTSGLFSSVQSLSRVRLLATQWTVACQASLSITTSRTLCKFMSIESVMPSNHLIICRLLLLPSIFPSIRVFYNESVLHIKWPKY